MKKLLFATLVAIGLSGCSTMENWSEREKQTAMIVASVVIAGIIIAESNGDTIINEFKEECRALPHGICPDD